MLSVMFLNRSLSNAETRYGPSKLKVACLMWFTKSFRIMVQLANLSVVVSTDHTATKGIMDQTILNTTSSDRANKRLINASIYFF
jgi:hypothetical protein